MQRLIWLDDARNPFENDWLVFSPITGSYDVIWITNYKDFCDYIDTNGVPDAVCFDHDLGDFYDSVEKTGADCAKYLIDYCITNNIEPPLYNMQSSNSVGRDNIKSYFDTYDKYFKS